MELRILTPVLIVEYQNYLIEEEKSQATINKYIHDIKSFYTFLPQNKIVSKEIVKDYKKELMSKYKPSSTNSMLAALNQFFEYHDWLECKVKELKVQKKVFLEESQELSRDEYERLVNAALMRNNERLYLLLQAICSTGIRVSEHQYITVDALEKGYATIFNKGKIREIFFSNDLRKLLLHYCHCNNIVKGAVFVTRSGRPLDRSNIWKAMKELCVEANVDQSKVYPHNLRHLFAVTYYSLKKDIARLADLLGHSSMDTTRIYTMSSGREFIKFYDQMDLVITPQQIE